MEATVSTNGRIVIPSAVRRKLGIKAGTRIHVEVDEQNQRLILTPITCEYIRSLRGKDKGLGLLKALMRDRQLQRALDPEAEHINPTQDFSPPSVLRSD